ncbi:hypothetical protein CSUB_C1535 [Candidatus Caldarchaeum subterraneum]|uniref:Uncharacterized protein n=1 Tax=Caldiarchaeum subterraneum TaxID=311458 RepID=E6N8R4_CALS0|nr:hypothetical protein HGMM_F40F12C08 [Candidatus Caldarchaeum subterraneum]BAJ49717.1 hypothetical protein HGMM_F28H09C19 [Candidatus Caldarchaeum subterraneum]BAJ51386.1 hypothetical protein CSUB_C1535 [Candidatus Caldarchaeum subterraneum]
MEKNDIKEKLRDLVIEEEISPEHVEKIKRFIRLTKKGQIVFVTPKEKLPLRGQILLYLLGKKLAKELELVDKESASNEEISRGLDADYFQVTARLSELKSQNYVLSVERGEYIIVLARLKEILDRLESMIQEKV